MNEKQYIRMLAAEVYAIAVSDDMNRKRALWRDHNSLKKTRPLIYVRAYAADEIPELHDLQCTDPFLRDMERYFKEILYRFSLGDDSIFEPWYAVRAVFANPQHSNRWGFPISVTHPKTTGKKGSFIFNPSIVEDEDFDLFVKPTHQIDEQATAALFEKTSDILRDEMPVVIDRSPFYTHWQADISTDLGYIRGIEGMMWDMVDRPEWLHKVVSFMSRGIDDVQNLAEAAGDFTLFAQQNQAMPYACELPGPSSNITPVTRDKLWAFCASQETATVSPAMWEEFILQYQKPIYSKYGLLSYGCCEDMTLKFPILKREMKNLRRVAVTAWANPRKCAELLGSDYVYSWRPSPTDTVAVGFDENRVKSMVRNAFSLAREHKNHIDVTLKDVETVSGKLDSVGRFVRAVREVIDEGDWAW